ncbi:hypothetical protein ACJZ2D_007293 [Fusarium nematophilum]
MAPPELMASGLAGTPAGYGRACLACSKAKCKCILRTTGSDCERCFRLGKQCQPMTTSRRRIAKKTTSSRTAQLEEKLDDLVSILRATQSGNAHSQPSSSTSQTTPSYSASTAGHITSRLDSLATAATSTSENHCAMPHAFCASSSADTPMDSSTSNGNDTLLLAEPTPAEAEEYLNKFRDWLRNFPFMILPYDVTAEALRKERPFLWLCIMNITSMSVPQQLKLKDRIREEVATRVVVNHERSMDVLLGLITYLAWISSFVGKMDTLRWTPHMDECLTTLERDKEHPSDEVLVAFARYQLVADEAQKLLVRDVMGETSQAPTYVFRKSMLAKLQEIRDGMSPNLPPNQVLQAQLYATEVQVNSVGLFMQTIPVQQRIESMYTCLKAVRAWYDIFFSIPLEELPGAPFALYTQLSQVQVALYRLTTSEDPAWDKDLVRNTADLLSYLDQVIELFGQLDSIYRLKADFDEDTLFVKGAKIMRNIRASWEPALSRHLGSTPSSSTPGGVVGQPRSRQTPNPAQAVMNLPDPNMLDFADITWMSDVFGPWEF